MPCSGRVVSACRKRSTSAVAAAAPRLSWPPRPAGPSITWAPSARATATVPSALPPSATITSSATASAAGRWRRTVSSSSRGGTTIANLKAPVSWDRGMLAYRGFASGCSWETPIGDVDSMSSQGSFSHLDPQGNAHMVDVSEKPVTRRVAEASCRVLLSAQTLIRLANLPKGDAFAVARLAGIQGAKRTAELIPLAHQIPLDQVEIDIQPIPEGVAIHSHVVVNARTGAEMEALVACSTAALALYDMVKALEKGAVI